MCYNKVSSTEENKTREVKQMQLKEFLKLHNLNSTTCPGLNEKLLSDTNSDRYVGFLFSACRTIKEGKIVFSHYELTKCYSNLLTHEMRKWCVDELMGQGDISFIIDTTTMKLVF